MLTFIKGRPELVIEIILAIVLLFFAIYLGGPWYIGGHSTAIGNTIEADSVRVLTAIIYFIPAIITLAGVGKDSIKLRVYGTFGLFLAYLFSVILRWLTVGFAPFLWLFALGLALVAAVMYIVESQRDER
jgi:hypothetical protein